MSFFKHIHQNIMAYCRSKKICIDQWLGKYYCILERIQAKPGLANKLGLSQIQLGWVPGKFCNFYPQLKWHKIVIWTFLFLENWQFNHKLDQPLSNKPTVPERLSSQFNKTWNQGDFKSSNFPTLVNWEKMEVQHWLIFIKPYFPFFYELGKLRGSKITKSLELGKTWK